MSIVSHATNTYFLAEGILGGYQLEISEAEYEGYFSARAALIALDNVEQLFSICAMSYVEIEKQLAAAGIEYMLSQHPVSEIPAQFGNLRLILNLKISGLLTAFRAYKDQCQNRLDGIAEFAGDAVPDMKTQFNKAFDGSLEFRIMEALRNYAQHSDLPLYGTVYAHANQWKGGDPSSDSPSRSRITIDPYFSASALISTKRLRPKTREDIENIGIEKLDSKMLTRKYVVDFYECHKHLKEKTEWIVDHAGAYVEDAYVTLSREKGGAAKFIELQKRTPVGDVEQFHLSQDFPAEVKQLRMRWRSLGSVGRQYYSSEVVRSKDVFLGSDKSIWITD